MDIYLHLCSSLARILLFTTQSYKSNQTLWHFIHTLVTNKQIKNEQTFLRDP